MKTRLAFASFTAVLLCGSAALAELNTVTCGTYIRSVVKTEDAPTTTGSTNFVGLSGASIVLDVPNGASRCVRVTFTAMAACSATAQPDFCQVRMLDNNVEMFPRGPRTLKVTPAQAGHAFEWVGRVGPGTHNIRLQRRVLNEPTVFLLDDWTFDAQVHY